MMNNYLSLYPRRISEFEMNEDLITVNFIDPKPSFIEKLFFKKMTKKPYKIDLDEIGTFVWSLCDGTKTVGYIVEKCREKFQDKVEPAEERVEMFIKQLSKNKLVQLYEKK